MRSLTVGMWFAGLLGDGKGWIYLAIAIAALIFALEAVAIGILIRRMVQAKRRNNGGDDDHRAYALLFAGEALFGALSAETVLRVLLILTVVGAAALTLLIVIARAVGYDFVSADLRSEEEERLRLEPGRNRRALTARRRSVPPQTLPRKPRRVKDCAPRGLKKQDGRWKPRSVCAKRKDSARKRNAPSPPPRRSARHGSVRMRKSIPQRQNRRRAA